MKAMVLESLADVKTHPTPLSLADVPEPAIAEGEVRLRRVRVLRKDAGYFGTSGRGNFGVRRLAVDGGASS